MQIDPLGDGVSGGRLKKCKRKYTRQSEIQSRKQSILENTLKYKAVGNLFEDTVNSKPQIQSS